MTFKCQTWWKQWNGFNDWLGPCPWPKFKPPVKPLPCLQLAKNWPGVWLIFNLIFGPEFRIYFFSSNKNRKIWFSVLFKRLYIVICITTFAFESLNYRYIYIALIDGPCPGQNQYPRLKRCSPALAGILPPVEAWFLTLP